PGWEQQVLDPAMLAFLRRLPDGSVASVCTGGLILAAAGVLAGRRATTRRHPVGREASAPLARLAQICSSVHPIAAAVCDDRGVVTSGGVSLAIDGTLYLIGCLYGREAQDEVARVIEYDRSCEPSRAAPGPPLRRDAHPRWVPPAPRTVPPPMRTLSSLPASTCSDSSMRLGLPISKPCSMTFLCSPSGSASNR